MYFVWQQRLFLNIETLDHQPLDILHPGLRNYDAGPDFFNAKVKEDGIVWAGNVEMHVKASDWYRHHHQDDPSYDSVILHVVMDPDVEVKLRNGKTIKTVVMHIPNDLMERYRQLCSGRAAPLLPGQVPTYSSISCSCRLEQVPRVVLHDWITALCTQRMIEKLQRVRDLVEGQLKAWPEAFYVVLTRSFGTGVNSDNMERLARSLPYNCLLHHKDNLLQIQALLLGQAGLLQMQDAASKEANMHSYGRNSTSPLSTESIGKQGVCDHPHSRKHVCVPSQNLSIRIKIFSTKYSKPKTSSRWRRFLVSKVLVSKRYAVSSSMPSSLSYSPMPSGKVMTNVAKKHSTYLKKCHPRAIDTSNNGKRLVSK